MKTIYHYLLTIAISGMLLFSSSLSLAGNKDRSGEAGSTHLLINPWARTAGWGSVGTANAQGLEAMFVNVAGIAFTQGTQVIVSHSQWLRSTGTSINSFGVTQKVGESGAIGLTFMSMNFGSINRTTYDQPDAQGGIGTFDPSYVNIGIAYSKVFSNSIYGGIQVKLISEGFDDLSARGIAIDAGIQYVTGETDNIRFGITLRNWGTKVAYDGDGLSLRVNPPGQENQFTVDTRTAPFELPSQMNIGMSYDFLQLESHTMTVAANFKSNAFTNDQITAGLEYKMMDYLMLRGSYTFERGINFPINSGKRYTLDNGFSAGTTVQIPLSKTTGSIFAVDYAFRPTVHFSSTHSLSLSVTF